MNVIKNSKVKKHPPQIIVSQDLESPILSLNILIEFILIEKEYNRWSLFLLIAMMSCAAKFNGRRKENILQRQSFLREKQLQSSIKNQNQIPVMPCEPLRKNHPWCHLVNLTNYIGTIIALSLLLYVGFSNTRRPY